MQALFKINFARREDNPKKASLIPFHKFAETLWKAIPQLESAGPSLKRKSKILSVVNNYLQNEYKTRCHFQGKGKSLKSLFPYLNDYPTFELLGDYAELPQQSENGIYYCFFEANGDNFVVFYLSVQGVKFFMDMISQKANELIGEEISFERKLVFNDNIKTAEETESVYKTFQKNDEKYLKGITTEEMTTACFFAGTYDNWCVYSPFQLFKEHGGVDIQPLFEPDAISKEEAIFKLRNFLFTFL